MTEKIKTELGIFIKAPRLEIIECCGLAGLDYVVIDMEHVALGFEDLYPLVLCAENRNLKLIVRLPSINEEYFKWVLDLGIKHIQVPQIQTVEDVNLSNKYSFFYPEGERGLCRFVRSADYSNMDKNKYLKNSNDELELIFQIEGSEGIKNLDKIIANNHVKTIFIGPYDLSQSLGVPGEIWNPLVKKAMSDILSKCKESSIKVGVFTDSEEGIDYWSSLNIDFIEYGSDMMLFSKVLNDLKNRIA